MKPFAGSVEITRRCNAKCIMCPHTLNNVKAGDMPADDAIEFVRQEVEMGCTQILPHHLGEPTLHPEYVRIVRTIRENHPDIYLKLFTNGSGLHKPEIRETIAECADYIVVSLDGIARASLEKVRPGLNYDKVLKGWDELVLLRRRGELVTQGVMFPGLNEAEREGYADFWKARGADAGYAIDDVSTLPIVSPNPCARIYSQVDVRLDGTVGICCRDPQNLYPIGNAYVVGVAGAWYGEVARKMRRDHRAGKIDICLTCTWPHILDPNYPGDIEELE